MICVRLDGDVMFLIAGKTCGMKIDILGKYGILYINKSHRDRRLVHISVVRKAAVTLFVDARAAAFCMSITECVANLEHCDAQRKD